MSEKNLEVMIPHDIKKIYEKASKFKYGVSRPGFVLSPLQLMRVKKGTCWDQALFIAREARKIGDPDQARMLFWWKDNSTTHTATVVEVNKSWWWIETAWGTHAGVHEFETFEAAAAHIRVELEKEEGAVAVIENLNVDVEFLCHFADGIPDDTFLDVCYGKDANYKLAAEVFSKLPLKERKLLCPRHPDFYAESPRCIYRALSNIFPKYVPECVGFCEAIQYLGKDPSPTAFLVIMVAPKYRRQGIAEELVERIKVALSAQGYLKLIWGCDVNNFASIALAKKSGFREVERNQDNELILEYLLD